LLLGFTFWLPLHPCHVLFNPVQPGGAGFCSVALFSFRNLAGKDAGKNNTKMLRGLNADCWLLLMISAKVTAYSIRCNRWWGRLPISN
jgi:hypothetical protein